MLMVGKKKLSFFFPSKKKCSVFFFNQNQGKIKSEIMKAFWYSESHPLRRVYTITQPSFQKKKKKKKDNKNAPHTCSYSALFFPPFFCPSIPFLLRLPPSPLIHPPLFFFVQDTLPPFPLTGKLFFFMSFFLYHTYTWTAQNLLFFFYPGWFFVLTRKNCIYSKTKKLCRKRHLCSLCSVAQKKRFFLILP